MQKNTSQIEKQLTSPELFNPVVLTEFNDSNKPDYAMAKATKKTVRKALEEYGADTSMTFTNATRTLMVI